MEEIFIAIMERIAAQMPELSLVDEDYGQLETQEDTYPVTFPCVLIGNTDSNWTDIGMGAQNSDTFITVRLAVDCYDDTHYSSDTYHKVKERQLMVKELYMNNLSMQMFMEPLKNHLFKSVHKPFTVLLFQYYCHNLYYHVADN